MRSMRVSDIVVQVAATVIAAGITGLVVQGFGLFRRMSALESSMRDVLRYMDDMNKDFVDSHEIFEDGEYHHKRRRRV